MSYIRPIPDRTYIEEASGTEYRVICAERVRKALKMDTIRRRWVETGDVELTLEDDRGKEAYAYASETESGFEIEWDTLDTSGVR